MSERPSRSYLSTAWLLFFIWPPVVILFIAFLFSRLFAGDLPGWLFLVAFAVLGIICVLLEWLIRGVKWISWRRQSAYGCPVCGYDIRATPHRCPECGTRLLWGHLPGPRDRVPMMNDNHRRAY